MDNINTYISVLHGSLRKKYGLMKELLGLTKEQSRILDSEETDIDSFDTLVNRKEVKINEVLELDKGFNAVFNKVGNLIKESPGQYRQQILEMQNLIRTITDIGIEIENIEHRNKDKFDKFILLKRNSIKDFKISNKTAVSYYQNMPGQHREWNSYFIDSKK